MRCPRCGVNNYGDVTNCHHCGEMLAGATAQAPTQHRYGPCPYCGNPQAEYFAAGNGQCRACVRTFTWKREVAPQQQQVEQGSGISTLLIIVIVIVVAAAAASGAITAIVLLGGDDGDGGGGGGSGQSQYISVRGINSDLANPDPGENVTIFTEVDFKNPDRYDPYDVHVELFYTYKTAGVGATASNHVPMEIYWLDVPMTINITGPLEKIRFTTVLSLNDADGPVELQVKVYKDSEWENAKKPVEDKLTLAVSSPNSSILSY